MKKKLCILLAVCVFILTTAFCAFAANNLTDGVYEVSITLLHAEKDKSSMGNNYIAQNALLEVKDCKKYLTMVPSKDVANLQFWYYNDGSVSGNSTEATKTANVTIKGKTYSVGYTFPIVSDGETVGVKFKAPIMPVTPSARVKIDYGSAVSVTTTTELETTQVPTAQPASTTQASEAQTDPQVAESTTVQTAEDIPNEVVTEKSMADAMNKTVQSTTDAYSSTIKTPVKRSALPIIIISVSAILLIILSVVFYKKRR